MKKETEPVKEPLYDEELEGYYVANKTVVRVTEKPGQKKMAMTAPTIFEGDRARCDGYYAVVDNKKYLLIESGNSIGYVLEETMTRL